MNEVSDKLVLVLAQLEEEKRKLLKANPFTLDFNKKSWAACPEGQKLLMLTKCISDAKEMIEKLRLENL